MQNQYARLVDEVTRALEEEILSGELRPADHLTVLPLAQRFGMSQSTIREALLMLERRGLVKTIPRRGAYITRLAEEEAAELCRMRALIEGYAVTVGIDQVTDELTGELEAYVQEMALCTLPKNLPRLIQLDLRFHQCIARLAKSDTLFEVWSSLSGRIGALIIRSVEANRLDIADVTRLHSEVLDALATRSPRACCLAVINHYVPESASRSLHMESIDQAVQALVMLESK
jgi:DNA-binding GntR family transcriptional regulator